MLNLDEPQSAQKIALFNLGFRIFFLSAGLFAVISMLIWLLVFSFNTSQMIHGLQTVSWHAHEMIFGYAMAVISGFLLTAVSNWTNRKTLTGFSLFVVFLFWSLARLSPFLPFYQNVAMMFLFDSLFFVMLMVGILRPIIEARQWKQIPVVLPVILLFLANSIFYMGQLQLVINVQHIGLYAGFYLVLLLIFVMGRRVIPFFIEKGVDTDFQPVNYRWVDRLIIPLFVIYVVAELMLFDILLISLLALSLFILNLIRLSGWYNKGIWKKPLVWVLLLSYFFITSAFGIKFLSYFFDIPGSLVIHALAVGGVGMITVGMMSRVALGHSGRNVFEPPAEIIWIFIFLLFAAVFRFILPLFFMENYTTWILWSQLSWIVAFVVFLWVYTPILIKPRIDGRPG